MKEEKVIKSLKITSIVFAGILGVLSILLILNESFALFTSKTQKITYTIKPHHEPMLTTGLNFQSIFGDYRDQITEITFETNKDLNTIDTSIASFDVSNSQSGNVIGYLTNDPNNQDKYILHIATEDDKIYTNPDSSFLFAGDYGIFEGIYGGIGASYENKQGIFNQLSSINNILVLNTSKTTSFKGMFAGTKVTALDLSNFNTANATDMSLMFQWAYSLTSLNLQSFNTSNVTDMNSMFDGCSGLINLDLSSFDTANVTNMKVMFRQIGVSQLDLSGFNTSNVTSMSGMFASIMSSVSRLTTLDLSSFDTSNVTDMSGMFYTSVGLTSINLSSFNTKKVKTMFYMFFSCRGLTEIDASSFEANEGGVNMEAAFCMSDSMPPSTYTLTEIRLDNFDFTHVTSMSRIFRFTNNATKYLKDTQANRDQFGSDSNTVFVN